MHRASGRGRGGGIREHNRGLDVAGRRHPTGGPMEHPSLTLMRTPFVKRHTPPRSGFCQIFSARGQAERRPSLATCSVFISVCGCIQRDCTKHLLRVCRHRDGSDRECWHGSLRPRNISVPSCRPMQKRGYTCGVRQLGPGSGEGQHTSTLSDQHRMSRSQSGCPINREGSENNAYVLLRVL